LRNGKVNRDSISSGLFFLLGLFICLYSLTQKIGTLAAPDSGLMPLLSGAAICILALIGFAWAAMRKQPGEPPRPLFRGYAWRRSLFTLGALLAFLFLMKPLGFFLATIFFIGFLLRTIVPQRWAVVGIVAVLTAFFTYLIFEIWLQAQLPRGPWGI